MNGNLLEFEYEGMIIPFAFNGNDYMINATEMIKLFPKKRINDFLSNNQTKELILQLERETGIPASQLIVSRKGNTFKYEQGTWMHRKVAIAFAMWLNPKFYSWCLGKIDEIISNGYAFRDAEIQRLQGENNNLNSMIQSMQPQVNYYNNVLSHSNNTYTLRDICGEGKINVGYRRFMQLLEQNGYIYRDQAKKKWFLRHPWSNEGYTTVITVFDKSGNPRNVKRWTEGGRHWIYSVAEKLRVLN